MATVFLVSGLGFGDNEDCFDPCCTFSTKEKAMDWVRKQNKENPATYDITELPHDDVE